MSIPPSRSSHGNLDRLPSVKQIVGDPWDQYDENRELDYSLVLPPIRYVSPSPLTRPNQAGDRQSNNSYQPGFWPTKLPPPLRPQITRNVFEPDTEEEEEGQSGKDNDDDDDDESGRRPPTPPTPPLQSVPRPQPQPQPQPQSQSQSQSQQNSLTVPELRPILRLSPRALEEGGPELEAQQHSLLHQYRLPPSLSAENAAPAPPAYVYQTPTVPQPSSGPVPYSFNVLRTQQGDLVNVRTPSVRAQGILRPTAILEDEDESHKRYKCDWPGCDKKYDRPSSLEVHKHSHTRTQPFPCPESGCARAFSVKSNMLRHFRSHPRRSGLSAAEVSAASAKKAAGNAAAAEAYEANNNKRDEDRRKNKERGMERDKEMGRDRNGRGDEGAEVQRGEAGREDGGREGDKEGNREKEKEKERSKEKDKDKPRPSILTSNPKPPPILTITPAPSTSTTTTSSVYPATRARTAMATAIAAAASTSDLNRSEMSSAVAIAARISPSVSPSPSPLLSPQSPQSTYSSAPTSASGRSTDLLSPSFASASALTSASFSPASTELLTPYSIYSPNSQYSAQSPRSPTFSASASDKEGEKDKDQERPSLPTRAELDREFERRDSISPTPIPILVTAPSHTASPTISTRSPSPPQRHAFISTRLRSPSPISPQYRTRALYPVSETRTSIDLSEDGVADTSRRVSSSSALSSSSRQDTQEPSLLTRRTLPLPRRTRSPTQRNKDSRISIASSTSRTLSPPKVASHVSSLESSSMSLPSGTIDKGKRKADNSATEKTQDRGFWPSSLPEQTRAFHDSPSRRSIATADPNPTPGTLSTGETSSSSPVLENPSSQSESRLRFLSRLRQPEHRDKDRGFWPTENPVQKKAYHGHVHQFRSLIGDEEEKDELNEEEEEREDVMEDVEIAGDKKKGRPPSTALGILKPGSGKKIIERHQRGKDMNEFNLSKSAEKQPNYMDVDSSECASLSDPPNASMSGFVIKAGLGSRLGDVIE